MELKPLSHSPKILAFHKLTSKLSFGATNYSPPRFSRLLAFLQRRGYTFQPLEQVLSEDNPQAIAITFDDGYYHLADVLPLLMDKYRFQPIIFLPTRFLGKPNIWDYSHLFRSTPHLDARRIKGLARLGVEFGSHGHSHVNLCRCDDESLRRELEHSKALLEDIMGRKVNYISYPFGRYNQRVLEAVREAGYTRGFTMSFPEDSDTAFIIGRYAVYGFDACRSVLRKLSGRGLLYNVEKWKAKFTNKLSGGMMLYTKLFGEKG
jgi:peptidoglycan/xylan/chitin deacetylase (PgdA/CDA1 family)